MQGPEQPLQASITEWECAEPVLQLRGMSTLSGEVTLFFYSQQNFSGSNTFGTMKICSRQGEFELMSVNEC